MAASGGAPTAAAAAAAAAAEVRRAGSGGDLVGFRRSRSEPRLLRRTLVVAPRAAPLKASRSVGIFFPLQSPAPILPHSPESLPLDSEESPDSGSGSERGRANWVERVLEVQTRWRGRQHKEEEEEDEEDDDELCGVRYDSSEGEEEEEKRWDRESFARVLGRVASADSERFAQLALLCNLAYTIPAIKAEELRKRHGLQFVTSSLEKKSVAAAIRSELETDSTRPPTPTPTPTPTRPVPEPRRPFRPSVAYEIAASAASYVRSRARGLLSLAEAPGPHPPRADVAAGARENATAARGGGCGGRLSYKSEVAACVAASTVTAVVAAEEEARQEAAKDLRSPLSSPCEWFVCDEPDTRTRCFVIQVARSLARS